MGYLHKMRGGCQTQPKVARLLRGSECMQAGALGSGGAAQPGVARWRGGQHAGIGAPKSGHKFSIHYTGPYMAKPRAWTPARLLVVVVRLASASAGWSVPRLCLGGASPGRPGSAVIGGRSSLACPRSPEFPPSDAPALTRLRSATHNNKPEPRSTTVPTLPPTSIVTRDRDFLG